jgi:hypothetical protein
LISYRTSAGREVKKHSAASGARPSFRACEQKGRKSRGSTVVRRARVVFRHARLHGQGKVSNMREWVTLPTGWAFLKQVLPESRGRKRGSVFYLKHLVLGGFACAGAHEQLVLAGDEARCVVDVIRVLSAVSTESSWVTMSTPQSAVQLRVQFGCALLTHLCAHSHVTKI